MEETKIPTPSTPESGKKNNKTAMAVVAYILFFIPLLTDDKNDPFVKFHIKQGAVIFLIGVVAWALMVVLPFLIPLVWLVHLFLLVMIILGIVNVLNNKKEQLPIIGKYADKLNF